MSQLNMFHDLNFSNDSNNLDDDQRYNDGSCYENFSMNFQTEFYISMVFFHLKNFFYKNL